MAPVSGTPRRLVLASTSPYRRELLGRLGLPFACEAPGVDEQPLPGESPEALAARLAVAKARSVRARCPGAVIIGSDQVAALGARVLGKPGTAERARTQLRDSSGQRLRFLTALCVLDASDGRESTDVVRVDVAFRDLDEATIAAYVAHDRPLDCAGAFRSEALGVTLVDAISGDDPTALIGLPLIRLSQRLRALGFPLPLSGA